MRVIVISMMAIPAFFAAICSSTAQTARPLQFEAATVKAVAPSPPDQPININLGTIRNGRVTLNNVTLNDCIKFAYEIVSDAQIAGPDWIRSGDARYEIVGQFAEDTPRAQVLSMVQALLAERLKLTLHHEKRELPFLVLTVSKSGHKLRPPKESNEAQRTGAGRITVTGMPMSALAMLLSRFERQTIVDMTALQGSFSFDLQWTTDAIRNLARPDGGPVAINGQPVDPYGPSLYTAIQEQLGLRLESRKGPVDVIVVDHAERVPIENE